MQANNPPPGYTPIPDPTKLTTDAVNDAVNRIRELYDLRFEQLDLRLEQRFQAQQKAIDAALIASDLKSNALSEKIERLTIQLAADLPHFINREEYNTQHKALVDRIESLVSETKGLIPRLEYSAQHKAISDKVDDLKQQASLQLGRASVIPTTDARLEDLTRMVVELSTKFAATQGKATGANIEARLDSISAQINDNSRSIISEGGKRQGISQSWGYLVGATGFLATVISIVFALMK